MSQLRTILPELYKRWRSKQLGGEHGQRGEDGDEEHSTNNIVGGVIAALQTPDLLWWIELLWVICSAVGREARWLEGCRCHGDVELVTGKPYPKRRRMIGGVMKSDNCPWKGRRAVGNVLGLN